MAHKFLVHKGNQNIEAYIGSLDVARDGRLYAEIIEEFRALGAQTKMRSEKVDALERYRQVPLHAMFLYTSEDRVISDYILQNWGALDSLSGDCCDLHPTLDQFRCAEDAYDFIEKLDVVKDSGFRTLTELPGLLFWNLKAESEFVSFGPDCTAAQITAAVRTVFEEVRKRAQLASVRRARERLNTMKGTNSGNAVTTRSLWKDLWPLVLAFGCVICAIAIASIWVSPWVLGVVLLASIIVFLTIGALALRSRGQLSEKGLISILTQLIRHLPLLKKSGDTAPTGAGKGEKKQLTRRSTE